MTFISYVDAVLSLHLASPTSTLFNFLFCSLSSGFGNMHSFSGHFPFSSQQILNYKRITATINTELGIRYVVIGERPIYNCFPYVGAKPYKNTRREHSKNIKQESESEIADDHQNAHLISFKWAISTEGAIDATYHPEKHWHRFSIEVAWRISLSTWADTSRGFGVPKSRPRWVRSVPINGDSFY